MLINQKWERGKNSNWLEFPASCRDLAGAPDLVFLEAHWDRPASLLQVSKRMGGGGEQPVSDAEYAGQVCPPRLEISSYINYINVTQIFLFVFSFVFSLCMLCVFFFSLSIYLYLFPKL